MVQILENPFFVPQSFKGHPNPREALPDVKINVLFCSARMGRSKCTDLWKLKNVMNNKSVKYEEKSLLNVHKHEIFENNFFSPFKDIL